MAKTYILFMILVMVYSSSEKTADEKVTITFGGDVSFPGIVRRLVDKGDCSYNDSFQLVRPYFQDSDAVFVNLETPFAEKHQMKTLAKDQKKNIHLLAEEKALLGLKYENSMKICRNLYLPKRMLLTELT